MPVQGIGVGGAEDAPAAEEEIVGACRVRNVAGITPPGRPWDDADTQSGRSTNDGMVVAGDLVARAVPAKAWPSGVDSSVKDL